MGSKLFDVTGNTTAYYNLEPRQIKDVFVRLSPAARLRKRLLELRRRRQISVEDFSEKESHKPELDAFMVAPKYRKGEPRRQVISDVKTWADIEKPASQTSSGIRVIQYSQLGLPTSGALSQNTWQIINWTEIIAAVQNYAQNATEFIKSIPERAVAAAKYAAEAVGDVMGGKLHPFGAPRTSVHYSLEEGSETALLHRLKNAAKITAPVLATLLVLALPAYDWASNGQPGTDELPGSTQSSTDSAGQPPFSGAGASGGSPAASEEGTASSSHSASSGIPTDTSLTGGGGTSTTTPSSTPSSQEQNSSTSQPIDEGGFGGGSDDGSTPSQPPQDDNTTPVQDLTQPLEPLVNTIESTVNDAEQQLL